MKDTARRVGELLEYWGGVDVLVVTSPDVERVALKTAACSTVGNVESPCRLRVVRIAAQGLCEYANEVTALTSGSVDDCVSSGMTPAVNTIVADEHVSPESVARVALFLCDAGSKEISGAIIPLR